MQIAQKLTLPLALSVFVVLGLATWASVRADLELQEGDIQRDQSIYAKVLVASIEAEVRHGTQDAARDLVNEANRGQDRVLFLLLREEELAAKANLAPPDIDRLTRGETVFAVDRELWNTASTLVPVVLPGDASRYLWVQEPITPQRNSLRRLVQGQVATAVALGIMWVVVAIGLGAVIVGRPMRTLTDKARRIAAGDLSGPLAITQHDEIGMLATEVNRMCDELGANRARLEDEVRARLMAQEQLRHADRLNTVGKLASGIAHELGTPLTVISARAKMIASGEVQGEAVLQNARIVAGQADHIARIIRQLMDFARRKPPSFTHESLHQVVAQTLVMLAPLAEKARTRLSLAEGPSLQGDFDRGQIQQVVTNLVMNSIQAMPEGGEVRLAVETAREKPPADVGGPERTYAQVRVVDTGSGIPPELLPRIFEPFFTTKDVGDGTGLGLSVAWGLMRDHQGWISVESTPGKGSTFTIHLPLEPLA